MPNLHTLAALGLSAVLFALPCSAQSSFGSGCPGASGVTPSLAVGGIVKSGQNWTLEVRAPGGLGLGYLLVGFSKTSASTFGGLALPLDLGGLFADPLWNGCPLNVDPSYAVLPYLFDPNASGGLAQLVFPGFDIGRVHMQAINLDADFVTRIAGVSAGLTVQRTPPAGMVAIDPGSFAMGSSAPNSAPFFGQALEQPVHTVSISYGFAMAQYEVTQQQYQSLMAANPSTNVGPQRPVENVSWSDARDYCTALTAIETLAGNVPAGYEYRLPTEAEWEYACRAGTTLEFNTGFALTCSAARFSFSTHTGSFCAGTDPLPPANVGSYGPNAWTLYDMHGNVSEWCLDSLASYPSTPVADPFETGGALRIVRGGAWSSPSHLCRSASRAAVAPTSTSPSIGFRVVLAPILVP
jgi:formylglycine-generating enzyme required for sulfatase activity